MNNPTQDPTEGHWPLPWVLKLGGCMNFLMSPGGSLLAEVARKQDAELIAREVNEAPALRERVQELEAALDEAVELLSGVSADFDPCDPIDKFIDKYDKEAPDAKET